MGSSRVLIGHSISENTYLALKKMSSKPQRQQESALSRNQTQAFLVIFLLLSVPINLTRQYQSLTVPTSRDHAASVPISNDAHHSALERNNSVPKRALPAETILLENGATTFVSSLEDVLSSSTLASVEHEHEDKSPSSKIKSSDLAIESVSINYEHEQQRKSTQNEHTKSSEQLHSQARSQHRAEHDNPTTRTKNSTGNKPIPQHWQVRGLLNITHDYPLAYSQIIFGYVWPVMALITAFTNVMIVFVLTQRDMRTPTNVVLTAIAIADIFPIVVPVPWFVHLFAMGNDKQLLYPPLVCYFYQHSTRSVSEIFYFLSTWLNVLLAIQDYLTACQPKLAKKYCQIKVVVCEIIGLTICAFLLNLPQALKLVYKPVKFYYNNQLTWGCKAMQAKWFKDLVGEYVALYDDIFTAIIVLFVDGGPAVLLITLTALLIRQLQRQRIKGHMLMEQARTASKRRRERHRQQEYESSARVMIFVLLAFLAVKIPFATTYTLMIIQSRFEIHFVESLVDFQIALTLTDLVFVLSYPINFTIFCCCSKKFRHKCAQLLSECNNSAQQTKEQLLWSRSGSLETSDGGSFMSAVRRCSRALTSRASSQANSLTKRQIDHLTENHYNLYHIAEEKRNSEQVNVGSNEESASLLPVKCERQEEEEEEEEERRPTDDGNDTCQESDRGAILSQQRPVTTLLEDGSLCAECIMRYEQMRTSLSTVDLLSRASSASNLNSQRQWQKWMSGALIAQQQDLAFYQDHSRRTSQMSDTSSGFSWPAQPPPQPASLNALQQQQQQPHQQRSRLPQIITTACESIREQQSQEETSTSGHKNTSNKQRNLVTDQDLTDYNLSSMSQHSEMASHAMQSDDAYLQQAIRLQAQTDETSHQDELTCAKTTDTKEYQQFENNSNFSLSSKGRASIGDVCYKMRRNNSEIMEQRYSDEQAPKKASSVGHGTGDVNVRRIDKPMVSHKGAPERQRSLSLSNSNLSTLPNATGMLADALVDALLTTSGQSVTGSNKSGSKKDKKKENKKRNKRKK